MSIKTETLTEIEEGIKSLAPKLKKCIAMVVVDELHGPWLKISNIKFQTSSRSGLFNFSLSSPAEKLIAIIEKAAKEENPKGKVPLIIRDFDDNKAIKLSPAMVKLLFPEAFDVLFNARQTEPEEDDEEVAKHKVQEETEEEVEVELSNQPQQQPTVPAPPTNRTAPFQDISAACAKWCAANANHGFKFEKSSISDNTGVLLKVENNKLKCKKDCPAFYKTTVDLIKYTQVEKITINRGTEAQQQALLNELLNAQPPVRDDLQITLGENTSTVKQLREQSQQQQTQTETETPNSPTNRK